MIQLQLSPETPLARDGYRATRSVARAGTTHRLATGLHQTKGYFPGRPLSKGKAPESPTKFRCVRFKNVIISRPGLLGLRGCRGRSDQGSGLDGVQLGPAFVQIRLTQLGDLILIGTSAVPVLVVEHVDHLHPRSLDVAER